MRKLLLIVFLFTSSLYAQEIDVEGVKRSAEEGQAKAQFLLGYMLSMGEDLPKDNGEAIVWFKESAEQDYPPAQYALGQRYYYGVGVDKDLEEAAKWMKLATAERPSEATGNLASDATPGGPKDSTFISETGDINITKNNTFQGAPSVSGDSITNLAEKGQELANNNPATGDLNGEQQESTDEDDVPKIDILSALGDYNEEENNTFQDAPSVSGDSITNLASSETGDGNSSNADSPESGSKSESDEQSSSSLTSKAGDISIEKNNTFQGAPSVGGDSLENLASKSDSAGEEKSSEATSAGENEGGFPGSQGPAGPAGPQGIAGADGKFPILQLCLALGFTYLIVAFVRDLIRRLLLERKIKVGNNLFIRWKKD